jgi:hypothetical protein
VRWLIALVLAGGCSEVALPAEGIADLLIPEAHPGDPVPPDEAAPRDLALDPPDLAPDHDLASPADLRSGPDLAPPPDLRPPADLVLPPLLPGACAPCTSCDIECQTSDGWLFVSDGNGLHLLDQANPAKRTRVAGPKDIPECHGRVAFFWEGVSYVWTAATGARAIGALAKVAADPAGAWITYVLAQGSDLIVERPDGKDRRALGKIGAPCGGGILLEIVAGRVIASDGCTQVRSWDPATGAVVTLLPAATGPWAADPMGKRVAFFDGKALWTVPPAGGQAINLGPASQVWRLHFTPDGSALLYAAGDAVYRIPSGGGNRLRIGTFGFQFQYFGPSPDGKWVASGPYPGLTSRTQEWVISDASAMDSHLVSVAYWRDGGMFGPGLRNQGFTDNSAFAFAEGWSHNVGGPGRWQPRAVGLPGGKDIPLPAETCWIARAGGSRVAFGSCGPETGADLGGFGITPNPKGLGPIWLLDLAKNAPPLLLANPQRDMWSVSVDRKRLVYASDDKLCVMPLP